MAYLVHSIVAHTYSRQQAPRILRAVEFYKIIGRLVSGCKILNPPQVFIQILRGSIKNLIEG